jgi:pyrophosphatase PpaX
MVMMMAYDAILFDLDGTLVDSDNLILETFRQTIRRHFPNDERQSEAMVRYIGPPLKESFRDFTDDPDVIGAMIATYREVYQTIEFDHAKLFPHVIETLETLHQKNIPVGVVTTKFRESALPSMRHFGIERYTKAFVGLDDVTHHKPHPEPVLKALKALKHTHALMIGDNVSDIRAGKRAGIATAAVSWSIHKDQLEKEHPDHWLEDIRDVLAWIR